MKADIVSDLIEAANLLMVGMGVVFIFLSILIGAVTLMSWLNRRFPEATPTSAASRSSSTKTITRTQGVSPNLVAAISAAISQHRRNQ